jgi:hypothetical protein
VWGDARPANTVVDIYGKVWLIDFDWSGPANDTMWPFHRNTKLQWPSDSEEGGPIALDHDFKMLTLNGFV